MLDPEFFDESPWTDPDAMAALVRVAESILGTNRETGDYEEERMEEMSKFYVQFSKYQAKLGQFSNLELRLDFRLYDPRLPVVVKLR